MSGTGPNLPVRIEVQGTQQAQAQFNQVGEAGAAAMSRVQRGTDAATASAGGLRNAVGQAGYQVQDFAVQVQGGTSALTALAQQGSQFLGIFGTGGAVAGAALVVGILAYQLTGLGQSGETAADAMKRLGDEMEAAMRQAADLQEFVIRVNERFLSAPEAARLRQLRGVTADIARAESELQGRVFAAANLSRQIEQVDAEIAAVPRTFRQPDGAMDTSGGFGGLDPARQSAAEQALQDRRDRLRQELRDFQGEALRFERELDRLRGMQLGIIADGSNATPGTLRDPPATREGRPEREGPQHDAHLRSQEQEMRRMEADRERLIRDNETALERYNRRIDEITALAEYARLNGNPIPEETIRRATDAALADFERIEQATERSSQFANQLGFSFSSAFEDAIIKGKSFSEVLKGLEQDLARLIIRASVTQPLANAISGGVNSAMGSFSFAGMFAGASGAGSGNTFPTLALSGGTFANGGIMTAGGPLPLNRYAMGGIADSPQIALFGEGRTPEAYVPLPDGRRIPVAMQGGGGMTFAPTYNIDARGADASMVPRLRAEMVAIARASNAELLDSIQRGGSAARIVGRRA